MHLSQNDSNICMQPMRTGEAERYNANVFVLCNYISALGIWNYEPRWLGCNPDQRQCTSSSEMGHSLPLGSTATNLNIQSADANPPSLLWPIQSTFASLASMSSVLTELEHIRTRGASMPLFTAQQQQCILSFATFLSNIWFLWKP